MISYSNRFPSILSSSDISELLKIEGNRFEYEINQLLVLPKIGYRITTIPIKTIYSDGNKGSHFRIFQDSYLVYRPFIRFFFSSISSSLVDIGLFYSIIFFIGNHTMASLLIATVLSRVLSGNLSYSYFLCLLSKWKSHWIPILLLLFPEAKQMFLIIYNLNFLTRKHSIDMPTYI